MATIRILVTVCTALFAGLTLTLGLAELAPAAAQTAAEAPPGRPLNLLPQLGKAKKFSKQARRPTRVAQTKTIHRVVQRRGTPIRAFARRQNARAVASRQDDRSVTSDQDSLGYQAESQVQPPIDAWLRSPLPAASPAIARPPAATARDRINTTAETVSGETITLDAPTADTPTANLTIADTVRVADAGEINEIDLAASETPAPTDKSWIKALLAVLGGAFAAAAAARFLFVRRRIELRLS
jgi:hypothetical protein